jgi:hypothetical protein
MDLRLATLKTDSFYVLNNVSTLNQCSYPVSQLCVNTLLACKVIQMGFNSAR